MVTMREGRQSGTWSATSICWKWNYRPISDLSLFIGTRAQQFGWEGWCYTHTPHTLFTHLTLTLQYLHTHTCPHSSHPIHSLHHTTHTHRVCYERVTISPTYCTMILSAWWHGFYPGYYLAFFGTSLTIEASRKVSNHTQTVPAAIDSSAFSCVDFYVLISSGVLLSSCATILPVELQHGWNWTFLSLPLIIYGLPPAFCSGSKCVIPWSCSAWFTPFLSMQ